MARLALLGLLSPAAGYAVELANAVVVRPPHPHRAVDRAVTMLVDEVGKRARLRWTVTTEWPRDGRPAIAVGEVSDRRALTGPWAALEADGGRPPSAEGFHIRVTNGSETPGVLLAGHDPRGVLFGVGHLLRHLEIRPGSVTLPDDFTVTTAPRQRLRGHQLGFRPKTHSYDAWDVAQWEQYYRDLIVFGANAIELMPPRTDDAADSPHFPLPPMEMMGRMSQLADDYDLDVWIWYPAMDRDYADPATVERALHEWREVFEQLPRVDAVFVPGGDPGHTPPRTLMSLLARQSASLREAHPGAELWVSPQGFDRQWLDEFLDLLRHDGPDWLAGVVFGPQVRMSLPELRAAIPSRYPIRHYPDITHTRQCQYPVPDWDVAFAITEGRECINPRPVDQAAIFRLLQPHTVGFLTYSEGCNDDVNKAVWSALGWDPEQPVIDILREYSRHFIGPDFEEGFAQGLLALERNWRGPVAANPGIETTLRQFQQMERQAGPAVRANWRFQQALFRAHYDAFIQRRLARETALEQEATDALQQADRNGALFALRQAEATLDRALTEPVAPDLRARIRELAESLFQSIRMQLSVPRHAAIAVDRGASLDTLDYPLNNRRWLLEQFPRIRALPTEAARLEAIRTLVDWTNPGPGGFYDDPGNPARQPHLVRQLPFPEDPASYRSAKTGFEEGDVVDDPADQPEGALRLSWMDHAETLWDQPLRFHYTDLDSAARYRVRVVYGGDSPRRRVRLAAGDNFEIHPLQARENPYHPQEYAIPAAAIRDGELTLTWTLEPGLGRNGRGCQVAEVWLIKE
ncbi:MAG: hypothetical protein H7A45_11730 [Verrucomicrobiales bacterium]|nr:hypothetical protein [Verrucomicrobiales bacterium]MCP5525963.1 hypothetical protein [Verrucomicrobiales bacterium]